MVRNKVDKLLVIELISYWQVICKLLASLTRLDAVGNKVGNRVDNLLDTVYNKVNKLLTIRLAIKWSSYD